MPITNSDSRRSLIPKKADPKILMVPLYSKIRISYEAIESIIREFDVLLSVALIALKLGSKERLVWDIRLEIGSELKSKIFVEKNLICQARRAFLQSPMPRFVWRCTARRDEKYIFDFLFDATDIEQGNLICNYCI
jgi:hypothetical protein